MFGELHLDPPRSKPLWTCAAGAAIRRRGRGGPQPAPERTQWKVLLELA